MGRFVTVMTGAVPSRMPSRLAQAREHGLPVLRLTAGLSFSKTPRTESRCPWSAILTDESKTYNLDNHFGQMLALQILILEKRTADNTLNAHNPKQPGRI